MPLAYYCEEIFQSCLPHPKNSSINTMFKTMGVTFKMPKFSKVHNSIKNLGIFWKVNQVIYSSSPISMSRLKTKINFFLRYLANKVKMPEVSEGHNSKIQLRNFFQSCSGHQLIIPYQPVKFQCHSYNNFRDILLTMFRCQNFQRAITKKNFRIFFSKVNQVIYSSSHNSILSFNKIAQK